MGEGPAPVATGASLAAEVRVHERAQDLVGLGGPHGFADVDPVRPGHHMTHEGGTLQRLFGTRRSPGHEAIHLGGPELGEARGQELGMLSSQAVALGAPLQHAPLHPLVHELDRIARQALAPLLDDTRPLRGEAELLPHEAVELRGAHGAHLEGQGSGARGELPEPHRRLPQLVEVVVLDGEHQQGGDGPRLAQIAPNEHPRGEVQPVQPPVSVVQGHDDGSLPAESSQELRHHAEALALGTAHRPGMRRHQLHQGLPLGGGGLVHLRIERPQAGSDLRAGEPHHAQVTGDHGRQAVRLSDGGAVVGVEHLCGPTLLGGLLQPAHQPRLAAPRLAMEHDDPRSTVASNLPQARPQGIADPLPTGDPGGAEVRQAQARAGEASRAGRSPHGPIAPGGGNGRCLEAIDPAQAGRGGVVAGRSSQQRTPIRDLEGREEGLSCRARGHGLADGRASGGVVSGRSKLLQRVARISRAANALGGVLGQQATDPVLEARRHLEGRVQGGKGLV